MLFKSLFSSINAVWCFIVTTKCINGKIILAVCFWATQCNNSLIPFSKPKKTFFASNNGIFNIITNTHSFYTFNQKKKKKTTEK